MVKGEREAFDVLARKIDPQAKYIWFHAASLGEFEQGRPLIELIRRIILNTKSCRRFLAFGLRGAQGLPGADVVCYLPLDTPRNVRRFLDAAHPCAAFFIKYEFWKTILVRFIAVGCRSTASVPSSVRSKCSFGGTV